MTWFAFKGYPDVNAAGLEEKELVAVGFHGYATQAEADANPNSVLFGPQSAVIDSLRLGNATNPANFPQHAANLATSALGALTGQIHVTGIAGWFLRGLKMLFGGILIIAGIGKLTGASNQVVTLATKVVP